MDKKNVCCSFCGTEIALTKHLIRGGTDEISGHTAHICDECIENATTIIEEQRAQRARKKSGAVNTEMTPQKIVDHLDQYVIGQQEAKKLLAIAVYNHYKRVNKKLPIEIQKSNVLLIGPTGSGKTHLVKNLARFLEVPFAQADATTMTEAGYVGDDVDQVLASLIVSAGGDLEKAQRGIVYIDEIDKIAASQGGNGRDVKGEGVQQSLLKMLEGSVMQVNPQGGKKNPNAPSVDIDTTNILFIVAGAFSGITDVQNNKQSVGLGSKPNEARDTVQALKPKDLVKYGMIPEFIGRLPVLAKLDPLSTQDLVKILVEPKNSVVKQFKALFELDGVEAQFTDEFLMAVAEKAHKEGTGARGLRAIMENALKEHMFSVPTSKPKELIIGLETLNPSLTVVS